MQTPAGKVVGSVKQVKKGDALSVRLRDGRLETDVKEVRDDS